METPVGLKSEACRQLVSSCGWVLCDLGLLFFSKYYSLELDDCSRCCARTAVYAVSQWTVLFYCVQPAMTVLTRLTRLTAPPRPGQLRLV